MKLYPEGKPVGKPYDDYLGRKRVIVELPPADAPVRKVLRQHAHSANIPGRTPLTYEHVHAVLMNNAEHIHAPGERNGAV